MVCLASIADLYNQIAMLAEVRLSADISDKLIHFTGGGGECVDDAFTRLRAIIREGWLMAGSRMIRGAYRCVSFTEAPIAAFAPRFSPPFPFHSILPVRIDVRKELDL